MTRLVIVYCLLTVSLAVFGPAVQAASCDGLHSFSGRIETCTIETAGTYKISAFGAQGGGFEILDDIVNPWEYVNVPGGLGAFASGQFNFLAGAVLQILVGGQGGTGKYDGKPDRPSGGGGGGSFVAFGAELSSSKALVVAGGGAGEHSPGLATHDGPYGGSGGAYNSDGTGGGGFLTDGEVGAAGGSGFVSGGLAFVNGGDGGDGPAGTPGGFGGGGGGGYLSVGGGGGYSGGRAGGTGGGSFVSTASRNTVLVSGVNGGHGAIAIELVATPLPGGLVLAATGLILLGASGGRKRRSRKPH